MPKPPPPRLRRPPARALAGFACVLLLLGLGFLWLRDSSLVRVKRVTVTGVTGPDAGRVRHALEAAALDMTTLNVRRDELRTATQPFPTVLAVETRTDFPSGLRIRVRERNPVGAVVAGNQRVPVAADGTVMRTTPSDGLPEISAKAPPAGARAAEPDVRRAIALLRAAPAPLRARVRRVYLGPKGLTVPLRDGPTLYFGGSDRTRAKWVAATVVLADPTSRGATYLDLRLPERPAAGGLESAMAAEEQGTGAATTGATTPSSATAAAPTGTTP
jgi:cell division protein FtsQ